MRSFDKKILIAVAVGVLIGVFAAPIFQAPAARANFFDDLWKNLTLPFGLKSGNQETSTQPAPPKDALASPAPADAGAKQLYKPAIDYERAVIEAVKKASPVVVSITISKYVPIIEQCPYNPFSDLPPEFQKFFGDQFQQLYAPCDTGRKTLQEIGGGSGFIISPNGLILTNKHVVSEKNASYTVFTNDGKKYDAKVLARDPVQDLAVIRIEASNLPTIELGDSDAVELGQTAISIGNALGEFRNTVSVGVVSGLSRTVTASGGNTTETIQGVIQTDAAINPGNSGGPLLNLRGQVIGINTAIASGAENIGFAIPINRAKRDIESVKTSGEIQVPFLGVRYLLVTPELAKKQKLPADYGALINAGKDGPAVQPNSPAEKAGIKSGDIILEAGGKRIDQDHSLGDVISQRSVGEVVALKVNRGGEELTIVVTLEKRQDL